jgi:glycosyltransferase involved in cell wall biosynthesis
VVVVDNGSPDGTAEMARRLRPKDATNYVDNR